MNLTPWFPGTVAPARPGVYERRVSGHGEPLGPLAHMGFAYWDGNSWYPVRPSARQALLRADPDETVSGFGLSSESVWRGLAEEPKP